MIVILGMCIAKILLNFAFPYVQLLFYRGKSTSVALILLVDLVLFVLVLFLDTGRFLVLGMKPTIYVPILIILSYAHTLAVDFLSQRK